MTNMGNVYAYGYFKSSFIMLEVGSLYVILWGYFIYFHNIEVAKFLENKMHPMSIVVDDD